MPSGPWGRQWGRASSPWEGRQGLGTRLTVIGTGYLGATHAVCMAELGFEVLGLDVDADKIARLSAGELPFYEPGLEPMLRTQPRDRAAALHHLLRRGRRVRRRALRLRRHPAEAPASTPPT